MADFHQTGLISTLHRLGEFARTRIESELQSFSKDYKIALVLPALFSELEGPALGRIVNYDQWPRIRAHLVCLWANRR